MAINPELYGTQTEKKQDELARNRGENMEKAARGLKETQQNTLDDLRVNDKKAVSQVITELNKLRNDPVGLAKKLNNPATLALLAKNDIPIEYIKGLLDDMRAIDHQELLTQINNGNMGPVTMELTQQVEGLNNGYAELFANLGEKAEQVGPLGEDASIIAQLRLEVEEAEKQTRALLLSISQIH